MSLCVGGHKARDSSTPLRRTNSGIRRIVDLDLQPTRLPLQNLKSEIENLKCVVLVVQRMERGFPKGKTAFLQKFADVVSNVQTGALELVK